MQAFIAADALDWFTEPRSSDEDADRLRWDRTKTDAALRFLVSSCDLIVKRPGQRFQLSVKYRGARDAHFQLTKFLGAYGQLFHHLDLNMKRRYGRSPSAEPRSLARAFAHLGRPPLAKHLAERGCTALLELGSGTAPVLRALCTLNPKAQGWALDASAEACKEARRLADREGLARRIHIINERIEDFLAQRDATHRINPDFICLRGVANAFLDGGRDGLVSILTQIAQRFDGATVVISDYFGVLQKSTSHKTEPKALLQDLVQSLTEQGIPPSNLAQWKAIYDQAGLTLTEHKEVEIQGATIFTDFLTRRRKYSAFRAPPASAAKPKKR